jgi:putative tryptophan/tyrosine transport system substrate-binding protein
VQAQGFASNGRVIRDTSVARIGQFAVIQSTASSLGVELNPIAVRDAGEIEQALTAFARSMNGGLIVTASSFVVPHRDLIFALTARYRLPAVHPFRFYAAAGGLASYGPDLVDNFTRAAGYVDRILKGKETGRLAGSGTNQVRASYQSQDRQGAGPHHPADRARPRDKVIEADKVIE